MFFSLHEKNVVFQRQGPRHPLPSEQIFLKVSFKPPPTSCLSRCLDYQGIDDVHDIFVVLVVLVALSKSDAPPYIRASIKKSATPS